MYCNNCGNEIKPGMVFCGNCGNKIESNNLSIENNSNLNNNFNSNMNNGVIPNNGFNNGIITNANNNNNYLNNNQVIFNGLSNNNINYNNNRKDNNKLILIILVAFIVILLITFLVLGINRFKDTKNGSSNAEVSDDGSGSKQDYDNELNKDSGTRTVMVYIIGSDLESQGGAATTDISEMMGSNFSNEDVNLLLYVGGTKKWQNNTFDVSENAIYEVKGDNLKEVKSFDVKDMTDPDTLTEFIDYVYNNYETDLYDLILWDHGGGPLFGYGFDENSGSESTMSILEIDEAINNSDLIKETRFEIIGFDACLMSSIEIANLFQDEANYLVASSELEPGAGWDYGFLEKVNKSMSSVDFGKSIVDYYYDYYKELSNVYGYYYSPDITLSLIDLSKLDNVADAIDDLFGEVDSNITVSSYSKISRGASRAVMYGFTEDSTLQYDLVDLYDLVDELDGYDKEVDNVQEELSKLVIYERGNIDDCYGISMYFPVTTKKVYSSYKKLYDRINVSDNYSDFLDSYIDISSGERIVRSNLESITPVVDENDISAIIPEDMANNYQAADYVVFRKIDDGSFLPIYVSKDVEVNGTAIKATVTNVRISAGDLNGENVEDIIAIEVARDEDSVTYALTSVLQKIYDGPFETEAVSMYLEVDNNTKIGKIIDIKEISSGDSVSSKTTYNLNEWDIMQFVSSSYYLYDEDGKKLEDWKSTGVLYGTEIKIKDGYKFMVSELDKKEEYYYMFRVKDTQGNLYESNLVKAK